MDLALSSESAYEDIIAGLLVPQPRQSMPPVLLIMLVYTAGIPGIPFSTASLCGWGVLGTSLISHFVFWEGQSKEFANSVHATADHLPVLGQQLMRVLLFNIFGTFIGIEQTRQMRLNFWHVRLLQEAVQLHKSCRLRLHRLTANTLPAPIVRAIASRQYNFVKVYENVTLLQADMVGFTPLSSKYPPERVLGILSDIFEEFDELCEANKVDKVKTIGDAYIVCAGALSDIRPDDAERVVRMGLEMQKVVARIARKEGVDVAVRIGVHTGRCTGGIIGTVRFHFDMWGGAVYGAVKMEEQGEKGRVHISDATYSLVVDRFECTPSMGDDCEKQVDASVRDLGISGSYLVVFERPKILPREPGPEPRAASKPARRSICAPLGITAGGGGGERRRSLVGAIGAVATTAAVGLKLAEGVTKRPEHHAKDAQQPGGPSRCRSHDDITDVSKKGGAFAGLFGGAQEEAAIDERHSAEEFSEPGLERNMSNFFVSDAPPLESAAQSMNTRDRHNAAAQSMNTRDRHKHPTPNRNDPQASGDASVRIPTQRRGQITGIFAARRPSKNQASSPNPRAASALPEDSLSVNQQRNAPGAKRNTIVSIEAMGAVAPPPPPPPVDALPAGSAGFATATLMVDEQRQTDLAAETSNTMVRQLFAHFTLSALRRSSFAITLTLLLFGLYDYFTWHPYAVTSFYLMRGLGCVPAAAIPALIISFKKDIKGQELPMYNLLILLFPWATTLALVLMAPSRSRQFMLTMAYFQIWTGYTMLSLPTGVLTCVQLFLSIAYTVAEYLVLDFATLQSLFQRNRALEAECRTIDMSAATMVMYILAAQLLGYLHNRRRRRNLRNHAKLLVNQQDRMERITAEVECCEQLLRNVFPAIVLRRLQDKTRVSGDGTGTFAEKFHSCTFLFAKIVGLQQVTALGETGQADPADVVHALQLIFDRFDALADTFKVQKVRKTVNEYYMVAAGLPDPDVLPGESERALALCALAFSMVTVMDIINTEPVIRRVTDLTGVTLSCQVGIHSGDAIAGVIGKKRFQYDLCGDAVNTAARMCSYSKPGCITVSPTTLHLVQGHYGALYRGEQAVKGKGNMKLYFLTGRLHDAMRELLPLEIKVPQVHHPAAAAAAAAAAKAAAAISRTPSGNYLHTLPSDVKLGIASAASAAKARRSGGDDKQPGEPTKSWLQPISGAINAIKSNLTERSTERPGGLGTVSEENESLRDSVRGSVRASEVRPSTSAASTSTPAGGDSAGVAGSLPSPGSVAPYLTGGTYNLRMSTSGLPPGQFTEEGSDEEGVELNPRRPSLESRSSHRWEELDSPVAAQPAPLLSHSSSGLRVDNTSERTSLGSPVVGAGQRSLAIQYDRSPPPASPGAPNTPATEGSTSEGGGYAAVGSADDFERIRPYDPPLPELPTASFVLEAQRAESTSQALMRARSHARVSLSRLKRDRRSSTALANDADSLKAAQRAVALGGDIDDLIAGLPTAPLVDDGLASSASSLARAASSRFFKARRSLETMPLNEIEVQIPDTESDLASAPAPEQPSTSEVSPTLPPAAGPAVASG